MKELINTLRFEAAHAKRDHNLYAEILPETLEEAADRIEELEAKIKTLQKETYEFIHDELLRGCKTADECRDAISNYYMNRLGKIDDK